MFTLYKNPMVRFLCWLAAVLLSAQMGLEVFAHEHMRLSNFLFTVGFLVLWVLIIDWEMRIRRERRGER